jgi:hypothetical protein
LIAQIVGGVIAFLLSPQAVFADIESNELARACLRLAVYSNLSMAIIVAYILLKARKPRWLRWVAAAGVAYHILAGIDGARTALGMTGVTLVEPVFGPAIFHGIMFLILLVAVLIPEQQSPSA